MNDINWGKIHERLLGYPIDQTGPSVETQVADRAIAVLGEAFLKKASLVRKQLGLEIQKAGLPANATPYLYNVLGDSRNWPQMSLNQKRGLSLAIELLQQTGNKPRFRLEELPGFEYEKAIDDILKNLGTWGETKLLAEFLREYTNVIRKFQGELRKVHPTMTPEVEEAVLGAYIQQSLKKRSFNYVSGHMLKKAIELAFN